MQIPFAQKLAQQSASMALLKNTQKRVIKLQQQSGATIKTAYATPSCLVVVEALHEAARAVATEVDEEGTGEFNHIAVSLWPAVIKFVGKGLTSLAVANLAARNGVWNSPSEDGPRHHVTYIGSLVLAYHTLRRWVDVDDIND